MKIKIKFSEGLFLKCKQGLTLHEISPDVGLNEDMKELKIKNKPLANANSKEYSTSNFH